LARDYADFTVPPPFSSRVRNALDAESKSVRLSALVGAGGLWYGFGKIIMRL
jgi:GINS complex subunit 3